jgi:hypothetical protein
MLIPPSFKLTCWGEQPSAALPRPAVAATGRPVAPLAPNSAITRTAAFMNVIMSIQSVRCLARLHC